jgi:2'-5' RNA ligase
MRTFIAIPLAQEIRDYLACIQLQLKKCQADVKWVQPENIHLTLKFLGERDEKKIDKIKEALDETARDKTCFSLRLCNLGAFPKIDFPRVIWVGIDKGEEEIKKIAYELEEKIAKAGIPKEDKPFSSHITIARLKTSLNREKLAGELKRLERVEGKEFRVEKITLYKSTLTPKGPIYEVLREASLKTI